MLDFCMYLAVIVLFFMLIAIVAVVAFGLGWLVGASAEEPEGDLEWIDALYKRESKKL